MSFTAPTRTLTFTADDVANLDHYALTDAQDQVYDAMPLLSLFFREEVRLPGVPGADEIDALFKRLGAKGPMVRTGSGNRIEFPLAVDTGANAMWFRGGDTLTTTKKEGLTRAESLWAFATTYCALWRDEEWMNSGKGKALDRQKEQIDMEMRGFGQGIYDALWSTQTDPSASQKKIQSIQNMIPTTTTSGTFLGISRSSPNTWWRNQTNASVGGFAAGGLSALKTLRFAASANGGVDVPNLYISNSTVFGYGVTQIEGIHRVTDINVDRGEDLSTPVVRHMGSVWMWDDGAPSDTVYGLNTKYLLPYRHSEAINFVEHAPSPNNQLLALQTRIATGVALGLRRPDRFFVAAGITA